MDACSLKVLVLALYNLFLLTCIRNVKVTHSMIKINFIRREEPNFFLTTCKPEWFSIYILGFMLIVTAPTKRDQVMRSQMKRFLHTPLLGTYPPTNTTNLYS